MCTCKVVVGAASPWETVATVTWDRLDPLSAFHEMWAGDIGARTLKCHTTVILTNFNQNRILGTGIRKGRAVT